ncbi:unnamed protein product [Owenia fusiformis]|uniref:Large ribosomal subunit protein uL23m n=1 Tax=Owenia fusiformis TaxID=6347 RepID=A0A8J1TB28_OWEFU|nr:unnamed protein product [Owenia fusiformis]
MASKEVKRWIPLWKRLVKAPIYQLGDPQWRVFLPMFWMKMKKPSCNVPNDNVEFEVHPQMSRRDVKNYLEKIYGVNVLNVRTVLVQAKKRTNPAKPGVKWQPEPEKKIAHVTLADETFDWPDLWENKKTGMDQMVENYAKETKEGDKLFQKTWEKQDLPPWFR